LGLKQFGQLTNAIDQFSPSEISEQFLASWKT